MNPCRNETNSSSYSPSFNSYFNTDLADIAVRVTTEFPNSDADFDEDEVEFDNGGDAVTRDEDDGFEFDLSNLRPEDGEIRPVYPVFNRDLLLAGGIESRKSHTEEEIQIQLKNLFLAEPGRCSADLDPPSSSSSEADEMEEIPPGTYCVWEQNKILAEPPSPGRCTKSNSTGSSVSVAGKANAAWKLRDILKRSKSDGKEGLVVLTPKKKVAAPAVRGNSVIAAASSNGKPNRARSGAAREGYYGGASGENKRKSYLPYRQDLVGLFATPQAFRNMHLPPF